MWFFWLLGELYLSHMSSLPGAAPQGPKDGPLRWAHVQGLAVSVLLQAHLQSTWYSAKLTTKAKGSHLSSGLFSLFSLSSWPSHCLHPNFPESQMKCPLVLKKESLEPFLKNNDLVSFLKNHWKPYQLLGFYELIGKIISMFYKQCAGKMQKLLGQLQCTPFYKWPKNKFRMSSPLRLM